MKRVTEDGEIVDVNTEEVIAMVQWKTPYNHDRSAESSRLALTCKDPSMAQQQFQNEVNLENIVRKFLQTNTPMPDINPALFQDIKDFVDLQDSIVTQYDVEVAWNQLPAAVRNVLRDPKTFADYVDHCVTTGDIEPLRELGLAPKQEPPPPPESGGNAPPSGATT